MEKKALIDVSIDKKETEKIQKMKDVLSEFYPELEFEMEDFNDKQFRVKIKFDKAEDNEDYQNKLVSHEIWIRHH
ncbi:MAG: hypothetical protein HY062_01285 [Bacteroidetes bacterium]|nr:hypothetical protein [Bacteroidota bacterium]